MASRRKRKSSSGGGSAFKFVPIRWSESQLDGVRKYVVDYAGMGTKAIASVCDRGWKLSISQHPQTGRYLATITDKLGRAGCGHCCFIVEHGSLDNAVIGALYAAIELLDDGAEGNLMVDTEDDW